MSHNRLSSHLTAEQLVDYFDKAMIAEEIEAVERHFAECDACVERARRAFALCQEWEQWNARTHQAAVLRELMEHALQEPAAEAGAEIASLPERLDRWRAAMASRAQQMTLAVAEFVFGPRAAPVRVRGGTRGSERSPEIRLTLVGGPWAQHTRVVGDVRAREIVVRGAGVPQGDILPLVLLVREGHQARVAPLRRAPDGPGVMVHFTGVEPGDYLVAIEPPEATLPT